MTRGSGFSTVSLCDRSQLRDTTCGSVSWGRQSNGSLPVLLNSYRLPSPPPPTLYFSYSPSSLIAMIITFFSTILEMVKTNQQHKYTSQRSINPLYSTVTICLRVLSVSVKISLEYLSQCWCRIFGGQMCLILGKRNEDVVKRNIKFVCFFSLSQKR